MVSKSDIKKALVSTQIELIDFVTLKRTVIMNVREYYTRTGSKADGNELFIEETVNIICEDLKKHFTFIPIQEFKLALEYGANGVFGDIKHPCDSTFKTYLKSYLELPQRQYAKNDLAFEANEHAKLLPQATKWTEGEMLAALDNRYLECLELVKNGHNPRDVGGLLWDFLEGKNIVEMDNSILEEIYESFLLKLKGNKFDVALRNMLVEHVSSKRNNTKSPLISFARTSILKEYFKMELAAIELKNKAA